MRKSEKQFKWKVLSSEKGERLLSYIKKKTNVDISNKKLKSLIEKGVCKVNAKVECFASKALAAGDIVQLDRFFFSFLEKSFEIEKIKILFEDEYFIAIDKPSGIESTSTELKNKILKNIFLVHRLDKSTSGVLLFAKDFKAKQKMINLFSKKEVAKVYIAIVDGKVLEKKWTVKTKIIKKSYTDGKIAFKTSESKGIYSETDFILVKSKKAYSIIKCMPLTGRTHQIRLHLLEKGFPILGDYNYCRNFKYDKYIPRLLLHAQNLIFMHPYKNKKVSIKANLPKILRDFY